MSSLSFVTDSACGATRVVRAAVFRATSALALAATLATLLVSFGAASSARAQTADVNAEAQVFFERGNRLFEQSARARGARRTELLEEALQAYVATLRIVRSRNALFNAAVVLERLERPNEAFAYLVEYLAIEGLGETERRDGEQRLAAIRPRVAVVRIESAPPGAEVYVDRLDLAPRGRTPLELAVAPGRHLVVVRAPHHEDARAEVEAVIGETRTTTLAPSARPVVIELAIEGDEGPLLLDGERSSVGRHELAPGEHVVSLVMPDGRRRDERFTLRAGDPPRRLSLRAPSRATATLVVRSDLPATVRVDGVVVGQGVEVRAILDAGEHALEVESAGAPAQTRTLQLAAGAESHVRFAFEAPSGRRFGAWPAVLASTTGALTAAWGSLALTAFFARSDYDDRCPGPGTFCSTQFDRIERLNLVADVMLGLAAASLVTTIVLFARRGSGGDDTSGDEEGTTARLELRLSPTGIGFGGRFR
ncbi:MAG: PEGA domain-containing protein [Myxococcota bacterium]|nr:PEGA domain-containing protein [Myxococcota bacterium]